MLCTCFPPCIHLMTNKSLNSSHVYILQVSDGDELQLPLPLLLSHSLYNHLLQLNNSVTLVSSLQLLADPDSLSLADKLHPLLNISHYSHVCILTDVHVEASVCSRITRSVVLIESRGFLQFVNHGSLPWTNCDVMYSELPRDVFLRLGERYTFTVHLLINPMIAGACVCVCVMYLQYLMVTLVEHCMTI